MRTVIPKVLSITLLRSNLLALAAFLFLTCDSGIIIPEKSVASIVFPSSGFIGIEGNTIFLHSNESVEQWRSSIDGFLGNGISIQVNLSVGLHTIEILNNIEVLDDIELTILPIPVRDEYVLNIQGAEPSILIPSGIYTPVLLPYFPYSAEYCLFHESAFPDKDVMGNQYLPDTSETLVRDYHYEAGHGNALVQGNKKSIYHSRNSRIGDISGFYFINLDSSGESDIEVINAELIHNSDTLRIWIDSMTPYDQYLLSEFSAVIESHVLPRHETIWGKWLDINGDDHLDILLTQRFNKSGRAVGLFNSGDFYQRSETNPFSNFRDIIYCGIPDTDNGSFSLESILATVAHELQHLTSFSHVYKQQSLTGASSPLYEEIFLDEGLAHFAENLSGYGISGGNMAFVSRYLEKTEETPLGQCQEYGYGDSVERRGGMALFVSWLFWRNGGITVDKHGEIIDNGGITLLQNLYTSRKRGWSRLEDITGFSVYELLLDFSIDVMDITSFTEVSDPLTGEPLSIDPYFGSVEFGSANYTLNGPVYKNLQNSTRIPPYALAFGQQLVFEEKTWLYVICRNDISRTYLHIFRK